MSDYAHVWIEQLIAWRIQHEWVGVLMMMLNCMDFNCLMLFSPNVPENHLGSRDCKLLFKKAGFKLQTTHPGDTDISPQSQPITLNSHIMLNASVWCTLTWAVFIYNPALVSTPNLSLLCCLTPTLSGTLDGRDIHKGHAALHKK